MVPEEQNLKDEFPELVLGSVNHSGKLEWGQEAAASYTTAPLLTCQLTRRHEAAASLQLLCLPPNLPFQLLRILGQCVCA